MATFRRLVRHLDQIRPGWYNEIDVDRLDLLSPQYCILAQIWGYSQGKRQMGQYGKHPVLRFTMHPAFLFNAYRPRWRREIMRRRRQEGMREIASTLTEQGMQPVNRSKYRLVA
jgi:hypothetical protein